MIQRIISYFQNSIWLLVEKVAMAISGLVFSVLIARTLSAEGYGKLSFAMACIAIMGPIAKLGMDNVLIQNLVDRSVEVAKEFLIAAFWLKTTAGLFIATILIVSAHIAGGVLFSDNVAVPLLAISFVFQGFDVFFLFNQSALRLDLNAKCVMVQLALSAVIKGLMVYHSYSYEFFALAILLDRIILAACYYSAFNRLGRYEFFQSMNLERCRALFHSSWPLVFSGLAVVGYARSDQLMIEYMLGSESVGIYSVGVRLTEFWLMLPTVAASAFFPLLVQVKKNDPEMFQRKISLLYGALQIIGFVVGVLVLAFAGLIVIFLFGTEYEGAIPVFRIRIWETVWAAMGIINTLWIHIYGVQKLSVIFTSCGLVVNILLNFWWIPMFGISGAALASVVSICISNLIIPLLLPSTRGCALTMLTAIPRVLMWVRTSGWRTIKI